MTAKERQLKTRQHDAQAAQLLQRAQMDDIVAQPDPEPFDDEFCYESEYRRNTLKLVKEMPFIGLFESLQNQTKFEASGIVIAKNYGWVVFDSLRSIGRVDLHFNFRGPENMLIGEEAEQKESQWEGLTYSPSSDTFLVLQETYYDKAEGRLVSKTEELKFNDDFTHYKSIKECIVEFDFESENKGFESMYLFEKDGTRYIMGLCESNHCKSSAGPDAPGEDRGHGRIVVAKEVERHGRCEWAVEKIIRIPKRAFFLDYAGMASNGYMGSRFAVVSQEDAAMWVGEFDWDALEFVGKGEVFHFPRNDRCDKVYCNVEGIQFIDSHRVVLTSDKSKDDQPHSCMHKDQSIAIMALPK